MFNSIQNIKEHCLGCNGVTRIDFMIDMATDKLIIATEVRVEEIAIYDIYGRLTMSQQVNMTTRQQVIDVANLETGIYFINIKTDKGNIVRRFIKNEE